MSTSVTFKRAICRSAAEVKSKEDKIVLVLLALNYSREIEKEVALGNSGIVDEYYDFLKDSLYSTTENTEDVIKAADIEFPVEDTISTLKVSKDVPKSIIEEIKENPAPLSISIQESAKQVPNEESLKIKKLTDITDYDWNSALSSSGSPVQSKKETEPEVQPSPPKQLKVSPIPDAILYGDLSAYGIPDVQRIKLISQVGDIYDSSKSDQVYSLDPVPRSFKLGNREAVQHVNNEAEVPDVVVEADTTDVESEVTQ